MRESRGGGACSARLPASKPLRGPGTSVGHERGNGAQKHTKSDQPNRHSGSSPSQFRGQSGRPVDSVSAMPREKSTHVDDPAAVGIRLREARERAGLSQRQLAFRGCSPAYISRIESGGRTPSLQLLRELGARLGVTESWLATGKDFSAETLLGDAEVALRLDELE